MRKLLAKHGLTIDQIDLIEMNEAFASQAHYCQQELGIPDAKLNVNGGAIALGHPLGCTGAKLTATALHELRRRGGRRSAGVDQGVFRCSGRRWSAGSMSHTRRWSTRTVAPSSGGW